MPSEPKRDSRGAPLAAIGAVVAPPLLYVLSIGPAAWACQAGIFPATAYMKLYAPLVWLCKMWPGFEDALNWYGGFWV